MSKKIILPIRFGIFIAIGLIVYFLLTALLGFHTNPIFSFLNAGITGVGIYLTIKAYKAERGAAFEYTGGFTVGIVAGFVATLIFTLFFGIYAGNLNPDFMDQILQRWEDTYNTSLGSVIFLVAISGFATTVVVTLSFMQLFKDSWNTKSTKKKMESDN